VPLRRVVHRVQAAREALRLAARLLPRHERCG
jgi:ribosomal protein L16/L10AE